MGSGADAGVRPPGAWAAEVGGAAASATGGEAAAESGGERHHFQAEVSRLMDIIVNSLYSKKEIFLRELISNASDALDKIRFLALSEPDALGEGDQAKLEIRISFDRANKVLRLRDTGVGMTKDDLVNNLGTIAKSGTSSFLEAMQKGGDVNLIGQFGVGFYSVYLVADDVTVTSKNNADDQWVWSSRADGSFTIARDEAGNTLGRGTQIDIHLKDEAAAYLEQDEIEGLVMQYSEFINFPIYLEKENEVEREVVDETAEAEAAAQRAAAEAERRKAEEDGVVGEEEAEEGEGAGVEDEEAKPKMKIVKEIEREWEVLNLAKPIWTRAPAEVSEEDHAKFYEAVSRNAQPAMGMGMMMGPQPHMAHTHFKAEGDVEFKALLYVPSAPAGNFYEAGKRPRGLKLYVRRVFISDDFEELLPNYLGWVVGVVDSDTLPLSVSRETVQQSASLKTIRKKLVRKTIDMIKKLADKEAAEEETKEEEKEKKEEEEEEKKESGPVATYSDFWEKFSYSIKLGVIEDTANRNRLAKLLRFKTSASQGKAIGLEKYIQNMKDGQEKIFFVAAPTLAECEASPFTEALIKRGFEVIYFDTPVDEYVVAHMTEFDDIKLQNVAREDVKFGDEDEALEKRFEEAFSDLTAWWKKILPKDVDKVRVSHRLEKTPLVVASSKYGWSANMDRMMSMQAQGNKQNFMKPKKVVEINPDHPIIKSLKDQVEASGEDGPGKEVKNAARLLYSTALIDGGFSLDDAQFTKRIFLNVRSSLNVPEDAKIEPFVLPEVQEEALPEATPEEASEATPEDASMEAPEEPAAAHKTDEL